MVIATREKEIKVKGNFDNDEVFALILLCLTTPTLQHLTIQNFIYFLLGADSAME